MESFFVFCKDYGAILLSLVSIFIAIYSTRSSSKAASRQIESIKELLHHQLYLFTAEKNFQYLIAGNIFFKNKQEFKKYTKITERLLALSEKTSDPNEIKKLESKMKDITEQLEHLKEVGSSYNFFMEISSKLNSYLDEELKRIS